MSTGTISRPRGFSSRADRAFVAVKLAEIRRWLHGNTKIVSQQGIQAVEPQHLAVKHRTEIPAESVGDFLHRNDEAKLFLH